MTAGVELFDDWDAIEGAAAGALDRASRPSLFERLSWFRLIAAYAPPAGRMLALRAGDASTWLFLAVDGAQARAYVNWYSLRFSAIGGDPNALSDIARRLRSESRRLSRVELSPLAPRDPLPQAFREAGWLTFVTPATASWRLDTEGMDFDTYWAGRGSRLRNTARRKAKAVSLDIVIHTGFDPAAWADYERVYAVSWKPAEGSPAFLRALAEQEGAAGTLRLGIARKDGEPIAAQLWLVEDGVATIHKLAYSEAARDLSPGTLLSVEMFRRALDVDKVRHVDFGTGNDPYKAEWMDGSKMLERMIAFNPATLNGLAGAARAMASALVRHTRSN